MNSIVGVDLEALAAWMDRSGLGQGDLLNPVRIGGGTQNILVRFRRQDTEYVLRRPPEHLRDNSNQTMAREARMLRALRVSSVPHPRLIAACDDPSVLGAAFYLMEPVEGFNPTIGLPPLHAGSADLRHRMGLALVEGVAALGALDPAALGLQDFGKTAGFLERQVDRWRSQLTSYHAFPDWSGPSQIPGVEAVEAWLNAHRPSKFEPGVLHGDYHLANVLYRPDGPELAAIVDWELTTVGDPLLDLGWLLATWPEDAAAAPEEVSVTPWSGFPSAAELVEHYRSRSSRDLSAIEWYSVLACFKLGIILEGTHARASAGQAPKETGALLHAKTIGLFERALRWIR